MVTRKKQENKKPALKRNTRTGEKEDKHYSHKQKSKILIFGNEDVSPNDFYLKQPYVIAQEIAFRIKLKRPVSLGVYGPNFAHSVMPFAVKISPRETIFSVYDPNFPNQIRTLKLNNIRGEWIYDSAVYPDGSYGSLTWKGPGRLDYVPIDLRFASSGS